MRAILGTPHGIELLCRLRTPTLRCRGCCCYSKHLRARLFRAVSPTAYPATAVPTCPPEVGETMPPGATTPPPLPRLSDRRGAAGHPAGSPPLPPAALRRGTSAAVRRATLADGRGR
eukprot:gene8928-biopygen132